MGVGGIEAPPATTGGEPRLAARIRGGGDAEASEEGEGSDEEDGWGGGSAWNQPLTETFHTSILVPLDGSVPTLDNCRVRMTYADGSVVVGSLGAHMGHAAAEAAVQAAAAAMAAMGPMPPVPTPFIGPLPEHAVGKCPCPGCKRFIYPGDEDGLCDLCWPTSCACGCECRCTCREATSEEMEWAAQQGPSNFPGPPASRATMESFNPEDAVPSGVPPTAQHSAIAAAMMSAFDGAIEAAGGTVSGGQPSGPDAVPVPMPTSADGPDVTAGADSQGDAWPDAESWTSRLAPDSQFDEETLHYMRSLGVEVMARAALWYYWHSSCPELIPNVWTFDRRPRSPTPPEVRVDARRRCHTFVQRQTASGRALPIDHNVSRAQSLLCSAVRSAGETIAAHWVLQVLREKAPGRVTPSWAEVARAS